MNDLGSATSVNTPHHADLYLSAAHKSSGKTIVGIGIARALAARGLAVTPFKKGPDYIDAGWLGTAAGAPCRNLDFNTQSAAELRATFSDAPPGVRVVEGTKGLHDGVALDGSDSNAALAALLDVAVVLVLDTRGMTRGIAAMVAGMLALEPKSRVAGVILNRTGGTRHVHKLRAALERYVDIPVLGAVGESERLAIDERHLGLVTAPETATDAALDELAEVIARSVDLDALLLACTPSPLAPRRLSSLVASGAEPATDAGTDRMADPGPHSGPQSGPHPDAGRIRIGVPRDRAFCFYYPDDLAAFEAAGADLVFFDALSADALPAVDGLFIGGGFPERHLAPLAANGALRSNIAAAAADGLPVYAECGGLMYLSRSVRWHDQRHAMCGVLPLDVMVTARPDGRGYVRLRETGHAPWGRLASAPEAEIRAHEFHYSRVPDVPPGLRFAYEVVRGAGINGTSDGIVHGNVMASYAHLRNTDQCRWVDRFVHWVRTIRADGAPPRSARR